MKGSPLIDVESLARHLDDPDWRVVDCRFDLADITAGRCGYLEGHIPGAVFADLNDDLAAPQDAGTGRHPLPSIPDITAFFGGIGIGPATKVVVYDAANGALAARCWWLLRWLGHDNVALLNGGLSRWRALALPMKTGCEDVASSAFVASVRSDLIVTTTELMTKLDSIATMNLLDARDPARFRGEVEPIDSIAGHVPGARNQPLTDNLREDGLWKSVTDLQRLWEAALGIDTRVSWAVMCGSGVTACHLAISGVLAGYREPQLYAGSWSEWIRDPARPVARGDGQNAVKQNADLA